MGWMAKARWCLGIIALACATQIHATVFEVTLDTSALTGDAVLAFDLNAGDAPASSVTIFDFAPVNILGTSSVAFGQVSGTLDTTLTLGNALDDSIGSSEFLQNITLGSILTFRFSSMGGLPVDLNGAPDLFTVALLDTTLLSLVTTDLLSDVLVAHSIGETALPSSASSVLDPATGEAVALTVSVTAVANGVPEPGGGSLAMAGLLALAFVLALKKDSRK